MTAFAFWLFGITACVAGGGVVLSRNPVHCVLWLILAFFSSAGLFILQGAEFVAMLLVIVYVGAVAVLFLFVVMMLDVDFAALRGELARYLPLGLVIGVVLIALLGFAFGLWEPSPIAQTLRSAPIDESTLNTHALGLVLYDHYILAFQTAGLILLVAMIGAILLTLRHRKDVKRQDVLQQMWRDPAKAMRMTNPKSGQGL